MTARKARPTDFPALLAAMDDSFACMANLPLDQLGPYERAEQDKLSRERATARELIRKGLKPGVPVTVGDVRLALDDHGDLEIDRLHYGRRLRAEVPR